jgi:predicted amidohydrolase
MLAMLTSMTCPKGDLVGNLSRHRHLLDAANSQGCDLILFPEMSLTGYCANGAVPLTHPVVAELIAATLGAPAVCFGLVEGTGSGGVPYITQLVAEHGQLVAVHRKEQLGEGEERDFRTGAGAGAFRVAGTTCTMAICAEIGAEAPYSAGADVVLGPSAPGLYGRRRRTDEDWRRGFEWWSSRVIHDAERLLGRHQVLAVSSQAGATVDEDFPGWAALLGPDGDVVHALPDWRPGQLLVQL